MAKKRLNLVKIIFFCIFLLLFLVPFSLSQTIEIIIDGNLVSISVVYVGDVPTLIGVNITNSTNNPWYWWVGNMLHEKSFVNSNTTYTFWGPLSNDHNFYFDEGRYTFYIEAKNIYGSSRIGSKDFSVDTSPCIEDNNAVPPHEECDGTDLSGESCESLGYASGDLACSDCHFDTADCNTCSPNACDICSNTICSDDGKDWVTTGYTNLCGAKDSDLGGLGASCAPGECDSDADMFCDTNSFWASTGFCTECSGKDSSCSGECTSGACDTDTKMYCDNGAWTTPDFPGQYCWVCKDYDSECADSYSCTRNGECDTKANAYCQNSNWATTNYCQSCSTQDADCGTPICIDGTCDICPGAKKYCNEGVWEGGDNYCDDNRCGRVDSSCDRTCQHGTCDTVAHKYCSYGLWDSDWELYCDNCKGLMDDPYCINPLECGNAQIDYMELCDGSNLNGADCTMWPQFVGGTIGCSNDCLSFDFSNCILDSESCGDGIIQGNDQCDGNDLGGKTCEDPLFGFLGGELACTQDCKFDTTDCIPFPECGDGVANQVSEECDDTDFRGESCVSLGYAGGSLDCSSVCLLDKSGCSGGVSVCGDGVVQSPNDAGFNEQCDTNDLDGKACSDFDDYTGGTLKCSNLCSFDYTSCTAGTFVCGDGVANQVSEECDDTDFRGESCVSLGYAGGSLDCSSVCLLDKSGCSGGVSVCGDGVVQSPNDAGFNEQCDTNDLDGKECTDFDDYVAGDLDCSGYCTFDYTECDVNIIPVCGNGNLEPGETCDPNKAGGIHGTPCQEYDSSRFLGGIVRCSSPDCEIDLSGCLAMVNFCGDGKVTAGEHCDDKLGVGDVDCSDLSDDFTSGSLECDNCSYDTDDCVGPTAGYCGDGVVSVGEQCDSGVEGRECPDISSYFIGGTLKCEDCEFDTDACIDKETDFCGDGKVTGYEACDGTNLAGLSCTNFSAFTGGILVCNDNCNLDSTGCTLGNTTTCNNNKTDGDETDLNCGGMVCPACQNGDRCKVNADCISNYCINNLCKEATCTDNVKNGLESDVDCGGDCPGCPVDKKCNIDYDCQEGLFCNDFSNLCALPSCDDGIMNGDETDVDCGGGCSEKCGNGLGCISPNDCKSGYCEAGICTMDKNKDEDNDNLPDWWEETHFGGIEYYDGDDDPDRDGHSNLDESIDGTDPNDPNDPLPDKKHTFQIIFLILGLLLMLGSAGFLVYSRKMLVPQQKIAAQPRAMPGQRPMPGQRLVPGQKPGPARLLPGGVRRPQPRPGLARRGGFAKRTAQKKAARKSLLKGFGTKADESKVKAKEAGALPKTPGKPVQGEKTAKPLEKKPSEEFIPLSRLGKGKKPGKPVPAKPGLGKGKSVPGAKPATGTAPEQAEAFEKLKELSESYKKKKGGKEKQIKQAKR